MPSASKPHSDTVILGMHAGDQLDVFIRDEDGEFHTTARIATHNGMSPESMTSVIAGMSDVFGWRHLAAEHHEVPQPSRALPRARTAAAVRAVRGPAAHLAPVYDKITAALIDVYPGTLRFGQLHDVAGRARTTGAVHSMLTSLMKQGVVVKVDVGEYRAANGHTPEPEHEPAPKIENHPAVVAAKQRNDDYRKRPRRGPAQMARQRQGIVELLAAVPESEALATSEVVGLVHDKLGVPRTQAAATVLGQLQKLYDTGRVGRVSELQPNGQPSYRWHGV